MNDQNDEQPGEIKIYPRHDEDYDSDAERAKQGGIFTTDGNMLQTPEEDKQDKNTPVTANDRVTADGPDNLQSDSEGRATDSAGTVERKNSEETKLNQGLEEQKKV